MPGKNYIKVTSILFIISAIIGIIVYLFAGLLFGYASVDTGEQYGWLFVAVSVLYTILSILQLVAGVKGVKGCNVKEAAADLKKWGKILLVIAVFSGIVNFVQSILNGQSVPYAILSLLLGFVLPYLYLRGASLNEDA